MNGGESGEDAQTGRTRGKLRCGINIVAVFKIKKLFGNGSKDVKNTAKHVCGCANSGPRETDRPSMCVGVQTRDPGNRQADGSETAVPVTFYLSM